MHFRENGLNCQDAKSIPGSAKRRDKRPDSRVAAMLAMREDGPAPDISRSIGPRGLPQRQHSIETEAVDGLHQAGMLDLARDRA
jgi:hypothetical protein